MKIVLLPGMDGTGDLFQKFAMALRPELESVVVRYPVDQQLDYAELESIVRSRIPKNETFALLGESFSGPIALSIAASAPSNMCALILCCTFARNLRPALAPLQRLVGFVPLSRLPSAVTGFFLLGSNSDAGIRSDFVNVLSTVDEKVLQARIRTAFSVDKTELLTRLKVPVLYLRAKRDRAVPKSASELLLKCLPDMHVAEIDAPHSLLQSAPGQAAKAVLKFLNNSTNMVPSVDAAQDTRPHS